PVHAGNYRLLIRQPVDTLSELLHLRASVSREAPAYTFVSRNLAEEACWSFAVLDRRARAVAAALQEHVRSGARAILLYPPGLDFLAAFFACIHAGVTAVPTYLPNVT